MIAGSLAVLERPADGPLEGYLHDRGYPALAVTRTQEGLDGTPIQDARAAARIDDTRRDVHTGRDLDNDVFVDVDPVKTTTEVATNIVCDVTESGVVLAESVYGDEPAFPYDVVWNVTSRKPVPQQIAVADMHRAWSRDDVLGDVWMTGADGGDGARIAYHDRANGRDTPTIGLGFERPWDGAAIRGVCYQSGYVALYSANSSSEGVRFVAEELLPYCSEKDDGDDPQASVSDFADDVGEYLEDEGYDVGEGGEA